VRPVIDVAAGLKLFACAPRLAGHGPNVRDLMNVGWEDWVKGAEQALFELGDRAGTKVIVCGISLGALLATHLAANHPERVSGLIVLANAIHLRFWTPGLVLAVCEKVRPFGNRFYVTKKGADIADLEARQLHLTYGLNPIKSAVDVLRGGRVVRAELSQVRCPTLVIHGALDRVCPVANAHEFARGLGTTDVEVAIMPRSAHIVSVDLDRSDIAVRVESFVRRITGG
jgi:carboxylesterase